MSMYFLESYLNLSNKRKYLNNPILLVNLDQLGGDYGFSPKAPWCTWIHMIQHHFSWSRHYELSNNISFMLFYHGEGLHLFLGLFWEFATALYPYNIWSCANKLYALLLSAESMYSQYTESQWCHKKNQISGAL